MSVTECMFCSGVIKCLNNMERGKIRKYTTQDMQNAVDAVNRGISVSAASKLFKVPRITLSYRVKRKYQIDAKMGPSTILSAEEENIMVEWLLKIASMGFPATRIQLLDSVQMLIKKMNRPNPFKNDRPGKKWYHCFMGRHPQLTERLTQHLAKNRSTLTELNIRGWFVEVGNYLKDNNLQEVIKDPRRIFNADETAFFLAPKGSKCILKKGEKAAYTFTPNDDKECSTTLITANADGKLLPPMIVYKYVRVPQQISSLMPSGWAIGKSENGWMTSQTFYEFVANIFYPWVVQQGIPFPVVFFVDGHSSHLTLELSNFCLEKQIILIALYPNATHILQPMDVAVFHPLKVGWQKGVGSYRLENQGQKLRNENFAPLLKKVLEESISSDIIKAGFRACGLFPFDENAINYCKFFKQVNENSSRNVEKSCKATKEILNFFEMKIGHDKVQAFKLETSESWRGDIEDTSLYVLWKQMFNDVFGVVAQTKSNLNGVTGEQMSVDHMEVEDEQSEVANSNTRSPCHEGTSFSVPTPSSPLPSTSASSQNSLNNNIPSPFKSTLFWPKIPLSNNARRRVKEKIPAVATSDQWREYYSKKEEQKNKKEMEKENRKRVREEKKKLKENLLKGKKKKMPVEESSSDSSIDISLESELEASDGDEKIDYQLGDFVIVKYEEQYFPGKIIDINLPEFKVKSMIPSGLKDWRWPERDDIMWYDETDVLKKIVEPTLKNNRGIFSIPQIDIYKNFSFKTKI